VLRDLEGIIQKSPSGIARTLATYLRGKYERIEINNESIQRLLAETEMNLTNQNKDALVAPFTPGETEQAIRAGGRKKTPGRDGLTSELYGHIKTISREMVEIINQMFWERNVTSRQKQGEIICLSKRSGTDEPRDFRPITLLNTDYKILARLVARRLGPVLAEHLKDTQYCGVPGNSILDAAARSETP
jgi:hypothetical protein